MRVGRFLISLAVLGTLAACGSSSAHPTAAPAAATCGPGGGHTLAASSLARAYSYHGAVYGCAGAHQYRLGTTGFCINADRVGPVAVAGRLGAYASTRCGVDTGSTQVVVRRLSDGTQLSSYQASSFKPGPESFSSVDSIVVDRAGHVVWIASANSIATHRHGIQVVESRRGRVHVLDSSPKIVQGSLRRRGSRVTWRDGTVNRSTTLG